jgi:hypothetical protein
LWRAVIRRLFRQHTWLTTPTPQKQNEDEVSEHLTEKQFRAFGQPGISPAELLRMDAHLSGCAPCRRALEAALISSTIALHTELQTAAPEQPQHLSFEQMARYVDETLDSAERTVVSDHAASCAQCAFAVIDLRTFTETGQAAEAAAPAPAPVTAKPSWWESVRELFRPFAPIPAFGMALAVLLLTILAGWLLRLALKPEASAPQFANQPAVSPTLAPPVPPLPSTPAPEPVPLLAQLNDGGGQVTLDQQGKLTGLDNLPPAYQQLVKDALTTQRLERPGTLTGLNRRGSSLMGEDEQGQRFALQSPVGKVVFSAQPAFRWTPLAGAVSYVVEVYDEQFNLVTKSTATQKPEWTPPQPLARGRLYAWQVKASQDGQEVIAPKPPATQARFRVLAQAQADELTRARRTHSSAHLLLGLLYTQAGLLDEAEKELRALQAANPNAASARRLLANVQALRR